METIFGIVVIAMLACAALGAATTYAIMSRKEKEEVEEVKVEPVMKDEQEEEVTWPRHYRYGEYEIGDRIVVTVMDYQIFSVAIHDKDEPTVYSSLVEGWEAALAHPTITAEERAELLLLANDVAKEYRRIHGYVEIERMNEEVRQQTEEKKYYSIRTSPLYGEVYVYEEGLLPIQVGDKPARIALELKAIPRQNPMDEKDNDLVIYRVWMATEDVMHASSVAVFNVFEDSSHADLFLKIISQPEYAKEIDAIREVEDRIDKFNKLTAARAIITGEDGRIHFVPIPGWESLFADEKGVVAK